MGESTLMVQAQHTASHLGSGSRGVDVLATPVMIGLMEDAARHLVDPLIEPGQMTVGVNLNITHLAATPIGMQVTARAELVAVDGRRLTFNVEAHDEQDKVGEGTHTRAHHQPGTLHGQGQRKSPSLVLNLELLNPNNSPECYRPGGIGFPACAIPEVIPLKLIVHFDCDLVSVLSPFPLSPHPYHSLSPIAYSLIQ